MIGGLLMVPSAPGARTGTMRTAGRGARSGRTGAGNPVAVAALHHLAALSARGLR